MLVDIILLILFVLRVLQTSRKKPSRIYAGYARNEGLYPKPRTEHPTFALFDNENCAGKTNNTGRAVDGAHNAIYTYWFISHAPANRP